MSPPPSVPAHTPGTQADRPCVCAGCGRGEGSEVAHICVAAPVHGARPASAPSFQRGPHPAQHPTAICQPSVDGMAMPAGPVAMRMPAMGRCRAMCAARSEDSGTRQSAASQPRTDVIDGGLNAGLSSWAADTAFPCLVSFLPPPPTHPLSTPLHSIALPAHPHHPDSRPPSHSPVLARHHTNLPYPTSPHSDPTMGACCGKPDRKSEGYVLGGSNTSSNASAAPQRPGTEAGKAKPVNATASASSGGGHTLGSPSGAPQGELSASALAAQKRAEAAEKRGVQQGGGKLSQKLAQQKQQSPYAVEEQAPGRTNADWD